METVNAETEEKQEKVETNIPLSENAVEASKITEFRGVPYGTERVRIREEQEANY